MSPLSHCLSSLALFVGWSAGARVRSRRHARDDTKTTAGMLASSPAYASEQDAPLRFAKRGSPDELPHVSFPVSLAGARELKDTGAVSVRWLAHSQVKNALGRPMTWDDMARTVWGGLGPAFQPTHPDGDKVERQHFWSDFREVLAAQQMRRAKMLTRSIMPVHPMFKPEQTMEESAQRVRADFPTDFPTMQIKRFLEQGGLRLDPQIFQREECGGGREFVNGAVALSGLAGWAVAQVSPAAFGSKWHIGRIRPEEVAILVSSAELDADEDIRGAIAAMGLREAAGFTAYEDGSPVHPAWPAMHSAASSLSTWLEVVANLTDAQRAEVRLLDFSIAYWRTLAGVHYASDNRAGLALGQYIIRKSLPKHLAEMYNCDKNSRKSIEKYVQAKVKLLEKSQPLDWATWTPEFWEPPSLQD